MKLFPIRNFGLRRLSPREFVLFTQPKTGTYLLSPLLASLSGRAQNFAKSTDFPNYPKAAETEHEFNACIKKKKQVPVYMHHLTVEKNDYLTTLKRLKENNAYFACHTPYSKVLDRLLTKRNIHIFHMQRDPRDFVVSSARFYGSSLNNQCLFPIDWYKSLPLSEQISVMIKGTTWHNSARWIISKFLEWRNSPNCCLLKFEDLTAELGCSRQLRQLRNIATTLDIDADDAKLIDVFKSVYDTGSTTTGRISNWRTVFDAEHKQLAKEYLGDLLIEMGYESNQDW